MKINVTENKVSIKEEQILNENEYNIHKIQFDFSSEYTNDLVKVALFSIDNHTYKKIISNNECDIPPEVLTKRGYSILGVYAYKTEQDTLVLRYSPSPTRISVYDGSYKAEAENSEPITPSEIEQYQQILQNSLQQFQNQYNVLVEEVEGDIQAIENELQRKVDEGYFDGEDGYTPQKGVDYFTQEDIEEIENGVKNDLQETVLVNYSLIAETGSKIELSINTTNYKLTAILKDKNNATIYTSNEIDLPLETMVVSASYDNTTKKIILTLQNGTTVEFSVADLVSGLVSESQLQTILANYYTQTEINNLLANKVDKVAGKGLSTNDFTDGYKEQVDTNTEDIEDIQAENKRIKSTFSTTTGTGQTVTLNKTAEMEFVKPPLPMGDSEQEGEPSPDNEVPITNVTGDVEVVVSNADNTKSQTFTFPLGNEKLMLGDYLADDGIHHVRGKMTFNGTETYLKRVNDEINAYYYTLGNVYKVRANEINYTSNYFSPRKQTDSATLYNENKTFNLDTTPPYYVRFRFNEINTVEDFKSWVSQHNIILEYELKEEVIVPYTTAQQTVYNAIKQAISYEGQTNISSNQNAIFNVEAYLDTKVILSEKGTYSKPSTGIPKTDLSNAVQTSLNKADTALQSHQDISGKQDITDNTLTTINKTVPTAINEVNSIAKGANQALSYSNYQAMITAFNSLANDIYNVGQNVMIITLQVPDLWISGIESTSVPYTYTTDEAFTTVLSTNGYVQVGYYKLSALETQKVDLTNYVKDTDYATNNKAGVVRTANGFSTSNGVTYASSRTYNQYLNDTAGFFISKSTLENVITGKNLETGNNKVTTISSSSTNTQYPSAKAVYDYIQSLDGDGVSY